MTPEFWAILGVGVALSALHWRTLTRIDVLSDRIGGVEQRLARLEGQVELLLRGLHIEIQGGNP